MDYLVRKKIETFFAGYRSKFYKIGDILIFAGDPPSGVFFVEKGLIKQYAVSQTGKEIVLNIFRETSFFPMSVVLNYTDNQYYYEALTNVRVLRAPKTAVRNFILNNPDVLFDLLSRVYTGVDRLLVKQTHLMGGTADSLLLAEIVMYAERFTNKKKDILLEIFQESLAQQTGLARETVSRSLQRFQEKGLLSVAKGKIYIADLESLKIELSDIF